MGDKTKISWTNSPDRPGATWNPVSGCTKISSGCNNCYASKMAKRLRAMGARGYENDFKVTLHAEVLDQPLRWKKPRNIFVCSMGDIFHEEVPDSFLDEIYDVMEQCPDHRFLILTKRSKRMVKYLTENRAASYQRLNDRVSNLWHGVSIESDAYYWRLIDLQSLPKQMNKFVSFEPLVAYVASQYLSGIDWAIVGGESGTGARVMRQGWAEKILDDCRAVTGDRKVAFFMKQMGSRWAKDNKSSHPKGGDMSEWPEALRIQEFPWV